MASAAITAAYASGDAKYLITRFKEIAQKATKPTKTEKTQDAITTTYYENSHSEFLGEVVGLFDHLMKKVKAIEETVGPMQQQITTLTDDNKMLKDENKMLKKTLVNKSLEFERSQQYHNRDTFKLCGVKEELEPGKQYEVTEDTVMKVFDTASIPLKKEEISATYRVPGKEGSRSGPKNILIKTNLHNTKDRIMRNKKLLRMNEDFQKAYPGAFIVEQLTPLRSKVAYMLRQDTENVEKSWTINGRIKVILKGAASDTKPKTIDSLTQLKQVMGWSEEKIEKLVLEQ